MSSRRFDRHAADPKLTGEPFFSRHRVHPNLEDQLLAHGGMVVAPVSLDLPLRLGRNACVGIFGNNLPDRFVKDFERFRFEESLCICVVMTLWFDWACGDS